MEHPLGDTALTVNEESKDSHTNPGRAALLCVLSVLLTYLLVAVALPLKTRAQDAAAEAAVPAAPAVPPGAFIHVAPDDTVTVLHTMRWPGNIRQLINVAERAVLQNRRGSGSIASLLMADGEDNQQATTTEGKPLKEYVESFEKMLIDNTMRRHKGSISGVMDELCLPRRTLNEKMAKYGLQRGDYL